MVTAHFAHTFHNSFNSLKVTVLYKSTRLLSTRFQLQSLGHFSVAQSYTNRVSCVWKSRRKVCSCGSVGRSSGDMAQQYAITANLRTKNIDY